MAMESIIIWLVIGAVAGWLANQFVGGIRGGLVPTVVTGIIGAFIGGWLLPKVGVNLSLGAAWVNDLVTAFIGAVVLLVILKVLR